MIVVAEPVAMEVSGAFVSRSLKIRMQRVLPTSKQNSLIMEESDVVAHTCEPPHVADHSGRVDRHAAAGAGLCLRTGGLADPAGALRQRLPGWGSDRYALAHSLPKDERTGRTIIRSREQGRGGRRRGGGFGRRTRPRRVDRRVFAVRPKPP